MSLWSSQIEINIEDLFIILGPNLSYLSHDESYIVSEDLNESYESTNVFNIFENDLNLKKKSKKDELFTPDNSKDGQEGERDVK